MDLGSSGHQHLFPVYAKLSCLKNVSLLQVSYILLTITKSLSIQDNKNFKSTGDKKSSQHTNTKGIKSKTKCKVF